MERIFTYFLRISASPGTQNGDSPKGYSPKGDSPKGDSPKGDLAHIVSSMHQTSSRSAPTKSHLVPARGNVHPSHLSRNLKKVGKYTCHPSIAPEFSKLLSPELPLAPFFLTILEFSVVKFPRTYGTYIYVLSANSCLPGDPKWRSPKGDSPKGDSPKGDFAHIVSSMHQTSSRSATVSGSQKSTLVLVSRIFP